MKNLQVWAGLITLGFITLSCNLPGQPANLSNDTLSDSSQIDTAIAQTVEAITQPTITQAPPATGTPQVPTEIPTDIPPGTPIPTQPPPQKLRVTYIDSNRSLWLWEEGGGLILLDQSGDVTATRISSDGKMVMFMRTPDWIQYSLWVINADGSDLRELASQSKFNEVLTNPGLIGLSSADMQYAVAVNPYMIDWIPGEHSIVYNTSPRFEGPGLIIHNDLWRVNAENGQIDMLLKAGEGGNFYYSPDGQQIALVSFEDISLINSDFTNRRSSALKYTPVITYSEYMFYAEPAWAPDSSHLLVDIPPEDIMKQPPDSHKVFRIPVDGSQPVLLASLYPYSLREIFFSPDAARLAYLTQEGPIENNQKALHIADVDGSNDILYEPSNVKFDGWSPDSSHFIMTLPDGSNPRIGEAGRSSIPVANMNAARNVQWVDSDRFLFIGKINQNWQLRLGQLDGSSEQIADFGATQDLFWLEASFSIVE